MSYFAILEKKTLRIADNIITINPYVEQVLSNYIKGKIYQVENPVADIYYKVHSNPHSSKTILFVGDDSKLKSLGTLIKAFSIVIKKNTFTRDWVINVVGPVKKGNYYYSNIKSIISENNIYKKVRFKGFLLPEKLINEYTNAAFLVLSSIQETAPMCIAEAMASGLPVIASKVGGAPCMIEDGSNGFLFESNNVEELAKKMEFLMEMPSLRLEMGRVGNSIAKLRWRPESIAKKTFDVYLKILGKRF